MRLRDALIRIEGKFLLSYNDCAYIRELYDAPNLRVTAVSRLNCIKQRFEGGCQFDELLIANYDTSEREKSVRQLDLFDEKG